jgi:hypothetical protein
MSGACARPGDAGIDEIYLTNSGMMEVDFLPEHLVIIGGSYIGLEFAQMYRRFGSRSPSSEARGQSAADPLSDAIRRLRKGGLRFVSMPPIAVSAGARAWP